jgi:hypothetical protein
LSRVTTCPRITRTGPCCWVGRKFSSVHAVSPLRVQQGDRLFLRALPQRDVAPHTAVRSGTNPAEAALEPLDRHCQSARRRLKRRLPIAARNSPMARPSRASKPVQMLYNTARRREQASSRIHKTFRGIFQDRVRTARAMACQRPHGRNGPTRSRRTRNWQFDCQ